MPCRHHAATAEQPQRAVPGDRTSRYRTGMPFDRSQVSTDLAPPSGRARHPDPGPAHARRGRRCPTPRWPRAPRPVGIRSADSPQLEQGHAGVAP